MHTICFLWSLARGSGRKVEFQNVPQMIFFYDLNGAWLFSLHLHLCMWPNPDFLMWRECDGKMYAFYNFFYTNWINLKLVNAYVPSTGLHWMMQCEQGTSYGKTTDFSILAFVQQSRSVASVGNLPNRNWIKMKVAEQH